MALTGYSGHSPIKKKTVRKKLTRGKLSLSEYPYRITVSAYGANYQKPQALHLLSWCFQSLGPISYTTRNRNIFTGIENYEAVSDQNLTKWFVKFNRVSYRFYFRNKTDMAMFLLSCNVK